MHKTSIVTVTVAAVAAAVLSASAYARGQEFQDVFVVKESTETPTVVISGNVVPFKEVTLAAQLPGRVKFIAGIEGDSSLRPLVAGGDSEGRMAAQRMADDSQPRRVHHVVKPRRRRARLGLKKGEQAPRIGYPGLQPFVGVVGHRHDVAPSGQQRPIPGVHRGRGEGAMGEH